MRTRIGLTALAFLWCGMILGISFLEAPVKFTAPSLTLAVGLDVGRQVFGAFHGVQLALTAAALALVVFGRRAIGRAERALAIAVVALFLAQHLAVLPPLDARTAQRIAGATLPDSPLHWIYIALDAIKVVVLLTLGWRLAATTAPARRPHAADRS